MTKFLNNSLKPNWLFMWDQDNVLTWGHAPTLRGIADANFAETFGATYGLEELLKHAQTGGHTIIAGLYRARRDRNALNGQEFMYAEAQENPAEAGQARKAPFNLVKETKWAGLGAMLIHRSVLEDMVNKVDGVASKFSGQPHDFVSPKLNDLDAGLNALSDSSSFCYQARKAGHKTFIDFGVPVGHACGGITLWPNSVL
jgi:hypothetical protein